MSRGRRRCITRRTRTLSSSTVRECCPNCRPATMAPSTCSCSLALASSAPRCVCTVYTSATSTTALLDSSHFPTFLRSLLPQLPLSSWVASVAGHALTWEEVLLEALLPISTLLVCSAIDYAFNRLTSHHQVSRTAVSRPLHLLHTGTSVTSVFCVFRHHQVDRLMSLLSRLPLIRHFRKHHAFHHHSFFGGKAWEAKLTDDLHFVLLPRRAYFVWAALALGPALPAICEAAWRGDGGGVATGDGAARGHNFRGLVGGRWRLVGAAMCFFLWIYEVRGAAVEGDVCAATVHVAVCNG